jgi:hypothetical protein
VYEKVSPFMQILSKIVDFGVEKAMRHHKFNIDEIGW